MPKLTIDGTEIEVAPGTSILQACEAVGVEIPRFCYHDRLSVPANCRMCLVEVEKSPKPVASCAMACGEGMIVRTGTELVHKARRGVMEMLLINHPLDCPICDQGGECDLQDQAVAYGFDRSRYAESKRAVTDKYFGPLIKTSMNRCIQCTRCIRFAEDVAGVEQIGMLNRGEDSEIGTYVEKAVASELSGNLVDVCPVGALLSKPYSFKARPWELRKTDSIDVMDAVGCNIRIDTRGGEVMRILPRLNEDVNEEWISDKTRYAYDGLLVNRLDRPYIRKNGRLEPVEWIEAATAAGIALRAGTVGAIAGDQADMDSIFALKGLMDGLNGIYDCRQDEAHLPSDRPDLWRLNTPIAAFENCDALLLVGCNPRAEAAMLNARLTKARKNFGLRAWRLGENRPSTFPVETVASLAEGFKNLEGARNPIVLIGMGALRREDASALLAECTALAAKHNIIRDGWNGFNVLQTAAGRLGALSLGFTKASRDEVLKSKVLYLLGAERGIVDRIPGDAFVIYQGHHGGPLAARADIILPGSAYTEKTALYMNAEGRLQQTVQAVHAPGLAKEDWKIVRAIAEAAGVTLPYDTHGELRAAMPQSDRLGQIVPADWQGAYKGQGSVNASAPFNDANIGVYQSCAISRNSKVMAECAENLGVALSEAA